MVRQIGLVGVAAGMWCWQFYLAGLNLLRGGALAKPESGKSGGSKQPIKLRKTIPVPVAWARIIQACMTWQLAISDGSFVA